MLEVLPNAEMEKVDREKLPFLFQNSKSFDGRFRTEKKKDFIVCRFGQAIAVCGPCIPRPYS